MPERMQDSSFDERKTKYSSQLSIMHLEQKEQ